jgi:hypothetical protein
VRNLVKIEKFSDDWYAKGFIRDIEELYLKDAKGKITKKEQAQYILEALKGMLWDSDLLRKAIKKWTKKLARYS